MRRHNRRNFHIRKSRWVESTADRTAKCCWGSCSVHYLDRPNRSDRREGYSADCNLAGCSSERSRPPHRSSDCNSAGCNWGYSSDCNSQRDFRSPTRPVEATVASSQRVGRNYSASTVGGYSSVACNTVDCHRSGRSWSKGAEWSSGLRRDRSDVVSDNRIGLGVRGCTE